MVNQQRRNEEINNVIVEYNAKLYYAIIQNETDLALLLKIEEHPTIWIPKSQFKRYYKRDSAVKQTIEINSKFQLFNIFQ
jgi:hypothetical protein